MSNRQALSLIVLRNGGRWKDGRPIYPTSEARRVAFREWAAWVQFGII